MNRKLKITFFKAAVYTLIGAGLGAAIGGNISMDGDAVLDPNVTAESINQAMAVGELVFGAVGSASGLIFALSQTGSARLRPV